MTTELTPSCHIKFHGDPSESENFSANITEKIAENIFNTWNLYAKMWQWILVQMSLNNEITAAKIPWNCLFKLGKNC